MDRAGEERYNVETRNLLDALLAERAELAVEAVSPVIRSFGEQMDNRIRAAVTGRTRKGRG